MSDQRAVNLLGAATATLRDEILPGVEDPVIRIKIDHVTRLLWDVVARLSRREEGIRQFLASVAGIVPTSPPDPAADLEALEAARTSAETVVLEALPDLIEEAEQGRGDRLARLVEVERRFLISQDPDVVNGSDVVYRGGRIEAERPGPQSTWPEIDSGTLTAYLREREGAASIEARDVRRIPGGFSKETIFFSRIDAANSEEERLVIRKDLAVPLIEKSVANEHMLLRHLYAAGFPVAEPMWIEMDASRFGGAFLVSRRALGTSDASSWSADPARSRSACEALAQALATLHGYDPSDFGIGSELTSLSAGEHMAREVAHWTDLFHRKRAEAFPLQELPLLWLARNIPQALYDRPARILHGDVGFHNIMFDDAGRITALLDWEFSGLGDPGQDLCFVRQFVEPLMPWPEFLALYRERGGIDPCAEAEFFYRLWTKTRNAVGCVDAQTLFDEHMPNEMRFALAGHVFAPYMFLDQCETLLDHLAVRVPA